jgi:hypothetical protein
LRREGQGRVNQQHGRSHCFNVVSRLLPTGQFC